MQTGTSSSSIVALKVYCMATDRVRLEDDELKAELQKVDWGKFVQYGTIEVVIKDGRPVLVNKKETTRIDP